jgi:hypothetical protein
MARRAENAFSLVDENNTENAVPIDTPIDDSLRDIADTIAEASPDVQQHVVDARAAEETQKADGPVDADGVPYDESIHSKGTNGAGVFTAKGTWRKRRGYAGRASPSRNSTVGSMAQPTEADANVEALKNAARSAGIALAQMTFMTGQIIGGIEWKPILREDLGVDENAFMTDAYTNYCLAKNITDIPPGVALSFALIAYIGPRFAMPITQSRMSKVKDWATMKIAAYKGRKANKARARMDIQ